MMKRFEFAARSTVRNHPHQFWMHDNHAEELITAGFTNQKPNYIHMNPGRAGLVDKPEDWNYSRARNYLFQPALMEIDLMDINYYCYARHSLKFPVPVFYFSIFCF